MWHGKLTYELLIVHTYNDLASTMTRCVESLENVKLVVFHCPSFTSHESRYEAVTVLCCFTPPVDFSL